LGTKTSLGVYVVESVSGDGKVLLNTQRRTRSEALADLVARIEKMEAAK